jgi:chromosome segregation ATPase
MAALDEEIQLDLHEAMCRDDGIFEWRAQQEDIKIQQALILEEIGVLTKKKNTLKAEIQKLEPCPQRSKLKKDIQELKKSIEELEDQKNNMSENIGSYEPDKWYTKIVDTN